MPLTGRHHSSAWSARRMRCHFIVSQTITAKEVSMWFRTLLDSLKARKPAQHKPSRQPPASGRLAVEVLEDRCVPATLTISDVSIIEGNAGTHYALVTVTLNASSKTNASVNYRTANGTASAGSDYQAVSGTLTFAKGETSK